ncbi:hypothetical protein I4U23_017357 [Adineta vaga]|nr:hypothetical protein I4U23_017357 [Adineta vaga]
MDVNQRLTRIVHDTYFTRSLYFLEYSPDNETISPLSDLTLDRFCSKILPEIGHRIQTFYLERMSIKRILHATNYPNLNNLSLYDMDYEVAMSLFDDKNPLAYVFKNQISSLFISFNMVKKSLPKGMIYSDIFAKILTIFTNLRCLTFNPCASFLDAVFFTLIHKTAVSSTLVELHISVAEIHDCLNLLDGRFDKLHILHVTVCNIYSWLSEIKVEVLPNLRIFSLSSDYKIHDFDEVIVSLLRRMLNSEELHLNIRVKCYEKFIDGYKLKNDILIHMPRLHKFIFNIFSILNHCDQTNFPSNEHIEKTFEYFYDEKVITCIDHFEEGGYSQCHIYSYPYKSKVYNNITNNFQGGLFTNVTEVLLYDEHPFEYEFLLQISKSFPFMKELTLRNSKSLNNKQLRKLNKNNEILSIIGYPNLKRLDLTDAHVDYVELFLFDRKIALPNNLHLCVEYRSLENVTYNFTRYTRPNNCEKLTDLYFYPADQISERIKRYFSYTCIRCSSDFRLCK